MTSPQQDNLGTQSNKDQLLGISLGTLTTLLKHLPSMFMECGDPTSSRNKIPGYNTYAYIQNTCKCKSNKHDIEIKMHHHLEI